MSRVGLSIAFVVVAVAAIATSGCEFLLGSSEADITSFSVVGQTTPADINLMDCTVSIRVEPLDLTSVEMTIEVSEGATLTVLPNVWQDGVPQAVTVIAENGDESPWTITVFVDYGVVFDFNGERRFLNHGFVDSSGTYTEDELANGLPALFMNTVANPDTGTIVAGSTPLNAFASTSNTIAVLIYFDVGAIPPDSANAQMAYGDDTGSFDVSASTNLLDVDSVFVFGLTELGDVGGDVTGTFYGTLSADSGATYDQEVTAGFFKVRRGTDDL